MEKFKLCAPANMAALSSAWIISALALIFGVIALFSPFWFLDRQADHVMVHDEEMYYLELSYGLFMFCYYYVNDDEDWRDRKCFSAWNPSQDGPSSGQQHFDSTTGNCFQCISV